MEQFSYTPEVDQKMLSATSYMNKKGKWYTRKISFGKGINLKVGKTYIINPLNGKLSYINNRVIAVGKIKDKPLKNNEPK